MFLTKECDYAIRVVRGLMDLEIKSVKAICEREHIPRPFAYKILKKLEHNGIVRAQRGSAGGYQLTKTPEEITLFDVIQAVDNRLYINECLQDGYECPRNSNGNSCAIHRELARIQLTLINALGENTMKELV